MNAKEFKTKKELKDIDLGGLGQMLADYNEQFRLGSIAGRHIFKIIMPDVGENPDAENELEENQNTSMAQILGQFGDDLDRIGIAIEPIFHKGIIISSESSLEASQLRLNVKDRNAFLEYLKAL